MKKLYLILAVAALCNAKHVQAYCSDVPLAGITVTLENANDLYSDEDFEALCRITEAEATGQDLDCKKNMASVVINRVGHTGFPDTVLDVVFEKSQFSPTYDGRYWSVDITESTIQAVKEVIVGGVTTKALYFCNIEDVESNNTQAWFRSLKSTYPYSDSSGTSYYK